MSSAGPSGPSPGVVWLAAPGAAAPADAGADAASTTSKEWPPASASRSASVRACVASVAGFTRTSADASSLPPTTRALYVLTKTSSTRPQAVLISGLSHFLGSVSCVFSGFAPSLSQ